MYSLMYSPFFSLWIFFFLYYFFTAKKPNNHWASEQNRRTFFENLAKSKILDPLLAETWYSHFTRSEIRYAKVCYLSFPSSPSSPTPLLPFLIFSSSTTLMSISWKHMVNFLAISFLPSSANNDQGGHSVLSFYPNCSSAIMSLFPDIKLDKNKLFHVSLLFLGNST